jgi:hypothetical protein
MKLVARIAASAAATAASLCLCNLTWADAVGISWPPSLLAEEVLASPDRNYFVLLSNLGLSSYAIAVIDREGKIILSKKHDLASMHYCEKSVTNIRHWVDVKNPDVRFEITRDESTAPARAYLKSVSVRGCDGKDVVLTRSVPGP